MKLINIINRKGIAVAFAKVDDENYEYLTKFRWSKFAYKGCTYAISSIGMKDGTRKSIFMHREIMGSPKGKFLDHVNGDGLDNRKSNLRHCSHSENMKNRKLNINNKSGLKGVSKAKNRWRAQICINNKRIKIGYFIDKFDAALAYDKAARKYFGEFARTNY